MALELLTYTDKTAGSANENEAKFFDADANELKTKVNATITKVNELDGAQIVSPNPFYDSWTSLLALQTAHPVGEENAWAFIDAGAGITPQIAVWDIVEEVWEIAGASETIIYYNSFTNFPGTGQANKIYIARDTYYAYVFDNNSYQRLNPNAADWQSKFLRQKVALASINLGDVTNGSIAAATDTTNITHLIFDEYFTSILQKAFNLKEDYNFLINAYNVSKRSHLKALITSWELVDDNNKLQVGISGIAHADVDESDTIQFFLPQQTEDYIRIAVSGYNDLYFNTVGNSDRSKYQAGNFFKGHPSNTTYVVGRVIDATGFDPYDTTKAALLLDF